MLWHFDGTKPILYIPHCIIEPSLSGFNRKIPLNAAESQVVGQKLFQGQNERERKRCRNGTAPITEHVFREQDQALKVQDLKGGLFLHRTIVVFKVIVLYISNDQVWSLSYHNPDLWMQHNGEMAANPNGVGHSLSVPFSYAPFSPH